MGGLCLELIPGCLKSGLSWLNWWVSVTPDFQCCYFGESSCLFILDLNLISMFSKIMHSLARKVQRKLNNKVSEEPGRSWGRGLVDRKRVEAPQ